MTGSKALSTVVKDQELDRDWRAVVEKITEEFGSDLPDDVIRATELLIAGYPTYKAAKELDVRPATIREWLKKYPTMALAVANGRKLMTAWRMSRLEQQFIKAVEKSEEILELDLNDKDVNAKVVTAVGQHARFIIGLFAGQQIDVNVKLGEEDQTFKAKKDALDYLVSELAKSREAAAPSAEPIEATYRVIDVKAEEKKLPLLDHEGNPAFGELGKADVTDEGTLCHICGNRYGNLLLHVTANHGISVKEYELVFMLTPGTLSKLRERARGEDPSSGTGEPS